MLSHSPAVFNLHNLHICRLKSCLAAGKINRQRVVTSVRSIMNKNEEKSARTKAGLGDAFMELYNSRSIEQISIRDITDIAGCSRATFYLHYIDIYDLLEKIEDEVLEKIRVNAADALAITDNSDALSPALYFRLILDFYSSNEQYFSILMRRDVNFVRSVKNIIRPALFARLTDRTAGNESEMDYLIEYQISAVIGVLDRWAERGRDIPVETLTKIIVKISSEGILPAVQEKIKYTNPLI